MAKIAPPLTQRQAARMESLGLLADEPSGLLAVWESVEMFWADTVRRARCLENELLDSSVNGQWSFIETLRHLIFVTDSWIGDLVLEESSPYDPIGLPPHFVTNGHELGLDVDAHPSLARVLDSRGRRMVEVRDTITETPLHDLDRLCAGFGGQFTVLGAFQNVIFEEWAHHVYATRDLAIIR